MSQTLIDLLNRPKVRQFIKLHLNDDPSILVLQGSKQNDLPIREIASQIQSRKKAQNKLPDWFATEEIIFPHGVSIEQCSSEQTARYKGSLVKGKIITDLTGGMGVDLFYMSKSFAQANYIERSEELISLAQHNFKQLNASDINFHHRSAESYLDEEKQHADLYFLDPARRDEANQKVFQMEDCTPNLNLIIPKLQGRKAEILIKMSPLLDIHQALKVLPEVEEVHVVSVRNECKELLFRIVPGYQGSTRRVAVNLMADQKESFTFSELEESETPAFSKPMNYLYEPNASIMKAGGFNAIAVAFGLCKIQRNSHLYTSENLVDNFPGRTFKIEAITVLNKKKLRAYLPAGKANITVRNYPMTVKDIRKKTGIEEGGDVYLFATTLMNQKLCLLVCKKAA